MEAGRQSHRRPLICHLGELGQFPTTVFIVVSLMYYRNYVGLNIPLGQGPLNLGKYKKGPQTSLKLQIAIFHQRFHLSQQVCKRAKNLLASLQQAVHWPHFRKNVLGQGPDLLL